MIRCRGGGLLHPRKLVTPRFSDNFNVQILAFRQAMALIKAHESILAGSKFYETSTLARVNCSQPGVKRVAKIGPRLPVA